MGLIAQQTMETEQEKEAKKAALEDIAVENSFCQVDNTFVSKDVLGASDYLAQKGMEEYVKSLKNNLRNERGN